jgi:hypothetical protein
MLWTFILSAAAHTRWPLNYTEYTVTINNSFWDFHSTAMAHTLYSNSSEEGQGIAFFVMLFDELLPQAIPYPVSTRPGMNAVVCYTLAGSNRQCSAISTIYDFSWSPQDDDHLSVGLIYESLGNPFKRDAESNWEIWELQVEFICTPGSDDENPKWLYDPTSGDKRVVMRFRNKYGCPISATSPLPTPTPEIEFDCSHKWRDPEQMDFGVDVNLYALNSGSMGYSINISGDESVFLLFQPCERILTCPWGAICDYPEEMPSAWLCNFSSSGRPEYCVGFGTYDTSISPRLIGQGLDDGFYWEFVPMKETKRSLRVEVVCRMTYPSYRLGVSETIWNGKQNLTLRAFSSEACARVWQSPEPLAGYCALQHQQLDWKVNLNLSVFDMIRKDVVNTLVSARTHYDIHYMPCNPMNCPYTCDCGGDEDGLIWLCEKVSMHGRRPFCTGYGLHQYNLSMFLPDGDMFHGVDVRYYGDKKRWAHVYWECNMSLSPDEWVLGDEISLSEDSVLRVIIQSKASCAYGSGPTPVAPPRWIPVKPVMPQTPTPHPVFSPNPFHVLHNASHYLFIDLEKLQMAGEPVRGRVEVLVHGHETNELMVWSPWDLIPCPEGFNCPAHNDSNLWMCWSDENWSPYCHPVGNKHVNGLGMTYVFGEDMDAGILIHYGGFCNVSLDIRAFCDVRGPRWDIPIITSRVTYVSGVSGAHFAFTDVRSAYACPRAYDDAPFIDVKRPPPPAIPEQVTAIWEIVNGTKMGIDLRQLEKFQRHVIIGMSEHYSRVEVIMSPIERIECPGNCGVNQHELSNIWECVGSDFSKCFPIGDISYGLILDWIDAERPWNGINARYLGSVKGEATYVHFFHNSSYEETPQRSTFDKIGVTSPQGATVLFAEAYEREPHISPAKVRSDVSGGAIFLLVVFLGLFWIFVVGTLTIFVLSGRLNVPFKGFWYEFWLCLITALKFLFCCKTNVDHAAPKSSYGNI